MNVDSRPGWNEYFMTLAYMIAQRSGDPSTKHGSVITKENRIIGSGYNHIPAGVSEELVPWTRPEKYDYIVHSERNALNSAAAHGGGIEGGTLYVTGVPCERCSLDIVSSGIVQVFIGCVGSNCVPDTSKSLKILDLGEVKYEYILPFLSIDLLQETLDYIEERMV